MTQSHIYLDHAAATPVDQRVLSCMEPFWSEQFYNPSALYLSSRAVKQAVDAARAKVASVLGAKPGEVIFTSGGTEGDNLAVQGVMSSFPGSKLVVSAIEHDAVLEPAGRYDVIHAPVTERGVVEPAIVKALVDDQTVLVSVMYANNEVGTIQPVADIAALVAEIRADRRQRGVVLPLYLHADACQAAGYLGLQVSRLGVDLMTLNGGKIYGPKGSGALYVRTGVQLNPVNLGGGQEGGLRSGTENVPGIVGFAEALAIAQADRRNEAHRLNELQNSFFDQIIRNHPEVVINGSRKHRLPNNLHVTFPGQDNERLLMQLDEAGIMAAAGSACSASNDNASHVLLAMGISETDARSSLRLTMGRSTTKEDLDTVLEVLKKIIG